MMVKLGNFIFHNRNIIFPLFYTLLFIPSPQLFTNPSFAMLLGFNISVMGQMARVITIGLVYIIRGGKNRRIYADGLVTNGIFGYVRNPLYLGNIFILTGLGIASNSVIFNGIATPVFIFFWQAIVYAEERYLRKKFGVQYKAYCSRVNRWLPDFKGLRKSLAFTGFNWKRVILKEYNATYFWMTGAVVIVMKHFYWHNNQYSFTNYKVTFIIMFALLTLLYLTVRYLKKSGKLTSD
jgi:protein-S-isoprenylcysteine O-methyltransferase Ste14